MSNQATIQRTVFVNVNNKHETYGYRIYDSHGQDYCNTMEKEDMEIPPKEFLTKVLVTMGEVGGSIFDSALNEGEIEIDGETFELKITDEKLELVDKQ